MGQQHSTKPYEERARASYLLNKRLTKKKSLQIFEKNILTLRMTVLNQSRAEAMEKGEIGVPFCDSPGEDERERVPTDGKKPNNFDVYEVPFSQDVDLDNLTETNFTSIIDPPIAPSRGHAKFPVTLNVHSDINDLVLDTPQIPSHRTPTGRKLSNMEVAPVRMLLLKVCLAM